MNRVRGEVSLIINGRAHQLCLTLGALAELETAFGCQSLAELQVRLRSLSAAELVCVLAILLKAGGETAVAARLSDLPVSPAEAARAVAEAFRAALA